MSRDIKRKELLGNAYSIWAAKIERCWAPGDQCTAKAIQAHSLQNSRVLDLLSRNGQVMMLTTRLSNGAKPQTSLREVGRNKATTFTGLCKEHDDSIFAPLEKRDFQEDDPEQLFLLAYRAVIRELHVSVEAGVRLQAMYQRKMDLGLEPRDIPTPAGEFATFRLMVACETQEYKADFDRIYEESSHFELEHDVIRLDTRPCIGVSSLFSLDHVDADHGTPRVALTIFPLDEGTTLAVFSYTSIDSGYSRLALQDVLYATGSTQKYLLSRLVLNSCDNIVLAPSYGAEMSQAKVSAIERYFSQTVLRSDLEHESEHLYLF